ncbi:MAG TPA: hypothetical protein VF640_01965 [Acidimicrobiales bacterium]|jgi:hypothetical protein
MCDCGEWTATRAGDGLRVTGRCTCPRAGYAIALEPVGGGDGVLVLQVVIDAPEFAATVMSTVDAVWEGPAAADVREVEVRPAEGSRAGSVRVAVDG